MIVSRIDPDSRSTTASAEGFHALGRGDTVLAREKFIEAGRILEDGAAQTESAHGKNLLRFLAASQHFHGGDYQRAMRIVRRTKSKYLPEDDQKRFEAFRKNVEERADPKYPDRIRAAVHGYWAAGQAERAIRLLQDHPYVLERAALAWARADLCYELRRWSPAAIFYLRAINYSDGQPWFVYMRAAGVMRLWAMGDTAAAMDYSAQLLKHQPTPLDLVAAASVRVQAKNAVDHQECEEVLSLVERALAEFPKLPEVTRTNRDVGYFLSHGYAVAVLAANRLGDRAAALQWAERGLAFAPDGPEAEAFRSVLSEPQTWLDFKSEPFAVGPRSLLEREKAIREKKGKEIESSRAA